PALAVASHRQGSRLPLNHPTSKADHPPPTPQFLALAPLCFRPWIHSFCACAPLSHSPFCQIAFCAKTTLTAAPSRSSFGLPLSKRPQLLASSHPLRQFERV